MKAWAFWPRLLQGSGAQWRGGGPCPYTRDFSDPRQNSGGRRQQYFPKNSRLAHCSRDPWRRQRVTSRHARPMAEHGHRDRRPRCAMPCREDWGTASRDMAQPRLPVQARSGRRPEHRQAICLGGVSPQGFGEQPLLRRDGWWRRRVAAGEPDASRAGLGARRGSGQVSGLGVGGLALCPVSQ